MKVKLKREDLKSLVKGKAPDYSEYNNELVKKAGFRYSESYCTFAWEKLEALTNEELIRLYELCRDSWSK